MFGGADGKGNTPGAMIAWSVLGQSWPAAIDQRWATSCIATESLLVLRKYSVRTVNSLKMRACLAW